MARNLGDFLRLQMSLFLVVPTRKRRTAGFPESHWLGRRQQEERTLLSPCQDKREESIPRILLSSWMRLSQGLAYIPLVSMRILLLNCYYSTFSRGKAIPGHGWP